MDDRDELVTWLLGEGFTHDEIERAITPIYLLAARAVGEAAHEQRVERNDVHWSFAGTRRLKNVRGEVKLFRARESTGLGDPS